MITKEKRMDRDRAIEHDKQRRGTLIGGMSPERNRDAPSEEPAILQFKHIARLFMSLLAFGMHEVNRFFLQGCSRMCA